MFTAVMSLGLVCLVAVSGAAFSQKIDEMISEAKKDPSK
jgi:hypothetical protein